MVRGETVCGERVRRRNGLRRIGCGEMTGSAKIWIVNFKVGTQNQTKTQVVSIPI